MAREDVKVNLPVNEPDATVKLVEKIGARNTALGDDSPIKDDFDFVAAAAGAAEVKQLRKDAKAADRLEQQKSNKMKNIIGVGEGQNLSFKKTLHVSLTKIRNILLVRYQDNPEELSVWGFEVVVSSVEGKRTVRVELFLDNPEKLLQLCADIITEHTNQGVDSPLNGKVDMTTFATNTDSAKTLFDEAEEQREIKESKHGLALAKLGYAEGQTSDTPDTAYNFITVVRDLLLEVHDENPKELEMWGFDVVVGSTATGGGQQAAPTP